MVQTLAHELAGAPSAAVCGPADTPRTMSEASTTPDLIELVNRVREAVNRRDFDGVESFYAPDAVLRGAEAGTFEGASAIRGLAEDMASPHEELYVEAEEIIDLGNGVAFAVIIVTGRPVGSNGEIRFRWASVAIWTDGVIEREMRNVSIDEGRAAAERLAKERAIVDG